MTPRTALVSLLTSLSTLLFCSLAQADAAACGLIVESLPANAPAWRDLGYELTVEKDLAHWTRAQMASRLNDQTYMIYPRGKGNAELRFSTTNGEGGDDWNSLSIPAPAPAGPIDDTYACSTMNARRVFFKESRAAILDGKAIIKNDKIDRPRGEVILDLERSYLVHEGHGKMYTSDPKIKYRELLKFVSDLRDDPNPDFFARWKKVRARIYSKDQMNIRYCDKKANMTHALLEGCVNCVGESYLLLALFEDSGLEIPAGWTFGAQMFSDHLRVVLYNSAQQRTYDMATGAYGKYKSAIFNGDQLYANLWKGHSALRFPIDWLETKYAQPKYEYRSAWCVFPRITLAYPLQASSFLGMWGCQAYRKTDPPEEASNDGKAQDSVDEDTSPGGTDQFLESTPAKTEKSSGGGETKASDDAVDGGFLNYLGKKLLKLGVGPTLVPINRDTTYIDAAISQNHEERAALYASYHARKLTAEAKRLFSLTELLSAMGQGDALEEMRNAGGANPEELYIQPVTLDRVEQAVADSTRNDVQISPETVVVQEPDKFAKISTSDDAVYSTLQDLSSRDRLLWIFARLREGNLNLETQLRALSLRKDPGNIAGRWQQIGELLGKEQTPLVNSATQTSKAIFLLDDRLMNFVGAQQGEFKQELRKAILTHVEGYGILGWKDVLRAIWKDIQDKPIDVLKWADVQEQETLGQIGRGFQRFDNYQNATQNINLALRKDGATDVDAIDKALLPTQPMQSLVSAVLRNDDFFVTVEPDADELPAIRPEFPLSILDEQVRIKKEIRPRQDVAPVNLGEAPFAAQANCDAPGAVYARIPDTSFWIECATVGKTALNLGHDEVTQSGIDKGELAGRDAGRNANDERTQAGVIHERGFGKDKEGDLVLDRPLTAREEKFRVEANTRVIRDGKITRQNADVVPNGSDDRQEFYIKPATWEWMLSGDPAALLNIGQEPELKILLHHAFRRKLTEVWKRLATQSPMMVIETVDVENTPAVTEGEFMTSRFRGLIDTKFLEDLTHATQTSWNSLNVPNPLVRENARPFVQIARAELSAPKPGYLVLNDGPATSLTEAKRAARYFVGWQDRGMLTSRIVRLDNGEETTVATLASALPDFDNVNIDRTKPKAAIKVDGKDCLEYGQRGGVLSERMVTLSPVGGCRAAMGGDLMEKVLQQAQWAYEGQVIDGEIDPSKAK